MNYRHEILDLNPTRAYLRVGDTWYDGHRDYDHQVGDRFLIGTINEVLSYDEYRKQYPESKHEMRPKVSDKTIHGGYLRKTTRIVEEDGFISNIVEYALNPQQLVSFDKLTFELND